MRPDLRPRDARDRMIVALDVGSVEAARRLGVQSERCAAVEDSASGIRAAHAAGMRVLAYPNRRFPPVVEALERASLVVDSLDELTPETLSALPDAD